MLQILFILMEFDAYVSVDSNDYFKCYSDLKYGFKKNAEIYFNIKPYFTQMVFGLATQKELEEISSKRDKIEYCDGTHQLSSIQFVVKGNTTYKTQTTTKGFLTPYSFGCNTTYNFYLYLEYKNCKSHSDYRIQNAIIYTMLFAFLFLFLEIFMIVYFVKHKSCSFYLIHPYLIMAFVHFLIESIILIKTNKYEFYTNSAVIGFIGIQIMDLSILLIMVILNRSVDEVMKMMNIFKGCLNVTFIALFFFIFLFSPIMLCHIFKLIDNFYFFLPQCIYLFICIFQLFLPAKFSLSRIGRAIFFIGNYFVYGLDKYFLEDPNLSSRTISIIRMNLIAMSFYLLTAIFLIIGSIYFQEDVEKCFRYHHLSNNIFTTTIPHINYTNSRE